MRQVEPDIAGVITSLRNPRVAAARKLRRTRVRRATGLTMLEGPHLLEEGLAAGVEISEVFAVEADDTTDHLCRAAGVQLSRVSADVMDGLADSVHPRGPVAVVAIPEPGPIHPADSIVMWDVGDPGNAGTIIRTAAAFGFQVLATAGSVDMWSPKVIRAGAGGHFGTTLIDGINPDLGPLQQAGLRPLVATADGRTPAVDAMGGSEPVALVVGNEAHGVPDELRTAPDLETITIAMPGGAESLNAAVAAAILMHLRIMAV